MSFSRILIPTIAFVFMLLLSIPAVTGAHVTNVEYPNSMVGSTNYPSRIIAQATHDEVVSRRYAHIENTKPTHKPIDELEPMSDPGCTDSAACNYNASATSNNGTCLYIGDSCPNADLCTVNSVIDANCDCVGEPVTCLSPGPCFTASCSPATGQCII
ncbi:MAG: hypothetical protein ACPGWM_08495, partial [Flavobacteriales bacterium]